MKTSLVNAFADVRLSEILEFHLLLRNTNTPDRFYLSFLAIRFPILFLFRIPSLFLLSHANLFKRFFFFFALNTLIFLK